MLTSDVDICNIALSHIGDEAQVVSIVPTDGSVQSGYCAKFYPIALQIILESFPWTFATKRINAAQITNDLAYEWLYAYSLPSTCLRPLAIIDSNGQCLLFHDDQFEGVIHYKVEASQDGSLVLYTNISGAVIKYIDLILDTTKYTPGFVIALSHLLASYLAGPIMKGQSGANMSQTQLKLYKLTYDQATAENAKVGHSNARQNRVPDSVAAHGMWWSHGRYNKPWA